MAETKHTFSVELTYLERIALCSLAPERSSRLTQIVMDEAIKDIHPTDEEVKAWQKAITDAGGSLSWDHPVVIEKKRISFSEIARGLFAGEMKTADSNKMLTRAQNKLWERIVEAGENTKEAHAEANGSAAPPRKKGK